MDVQWSSGLRVGMSGRLLRVRRCIEAEEARMAEVSLFYHALGRVLEFPRAR